MALPERTVFATMECAGNGRSFLRPVRARHPVGRRRRGSRRVDRSAPRRDPRARPPAERHPGDPMRRRGRRHGTGPPRADALSRAGCRSPRRWTPIRCWRPHERQPLSRSHGHPVRLIVPGWYGVCSASGSRAWKCSTTPTRATSSPQVYHPRREPDGSASCALTRMAVKSEIIRPRADATLRPHHRVAGSLGRRRPRHPRGDQHRRRAAPGTRQPHRPAGALLLTLWEYLWPMENPATTPSSACHLRSRRPPAHGARSLAAATSSIPAPPPRPHRSRRPRRGDAR